MVTGGLTAALDASTLLMAVIRATPLSLWLLLHHEKEGLGGWGGMMCSAGIEISLTPSALLVRSRLCQINYRESLMWVGPLGTQRNKTGLLHPRNLPVPEP